MDTLQPLQICFDLLRQLLVLKCDSSFLTFEISLFPVPQNDCFRFRCFDLSQSLAALLSLDVSPRVVQRLLLLSSPFADVFVLHVCPCVVSDATCVHIARRQMIESDEEKEYEDEATVSELDEEDDSTGEVREMCDVPMHMPTNETRNPSMPLPSMPLLQVPSKSCHVFPLLFVSPFTITHACCSLFLRCFSILCQT